MLSTAQKFSEKRTELARTGLGGSDAAAVLAWAFERAGEVFADLRKEPFLGREFRELSMGMSTDFELAIEHGATLIRVGSALFEGIASSE